MLCRLVGMCHVVCEEARLEKRVFDDLSTMCEVYVNNGNRRPVNYLAVSVDSFEMLSSLDLKRIPWRMLHAGPERCQQADEQDLTS